MDTDHGGRMLRVRWAAIGAAVTVAIGGGALGIARATSSSGQRAVFVPITPCRLVDTRPAPDQVGSRSTPLGAGEVVTQQATGVNGNCNVPADAVAVSLNATAVGGTAGSYFTFFPADAPRPLAANLNWIPGAPPTPNKVDVQLGASGAFKVFNYAGSVHLVVDVAGYYVDHTHDDRYYTEAEIDQKLGPQSHVLVVDPISAVTVVGSAFWVSADGCFNVQPGAVALLPLPLPDGAVITAVTGTTKNTGTAGTLTLLLGRTTAASAETPVSGSYSVPNSINRLAFALADLQTTAAAAVGTTYRLAISATSGGAAERALCSLGVTYVK